MTNLVVGHDLHPRTRNLEFVDKKYTGPLVESNGARTGSARLPAAHGSPGLRPFCVRSLGGRIARGAGMANRKADIAPEWRGLNKVLSNLPPDMLQVPIGSWSLSIVIDVGSDSPFAVGTAFPISDGVLVTAKHILKEFQDATEPVNIDRTVTALQVLPGRRFVVWRTTRAIVHKTADLAVLFASSKEEDAKFWIPSWTISHVAPCRDEWIGAFGHVDGHCEIVSRNPKGGGHIEVGGEGHAQFGVVKKIYDDYRDKVMLPCPCFEVSAKFSPGMSGGPVFNEQSELCGIVSTGFEGEASSFVVTLWPSLSEIYSGPIGANSG